MPVKNVQLHGRHSVEVSLDDLDGLEMTAHVDHETAPTEPRPILDRGRRKDVAAGCSLHELQKRLEPAHRTDDRRRRERRTLVRDVERVRFVLRERRDRGAGSLAANHECRRRRIRSEVCRQRLTGLGGQSWKHSSDCSTQPLIRKPRGRDGEGRGDREASAVEADGRRHGHELSCLHFELGIRRRAGSRTGHARRCEDTSGYHGDQTGGAPIFASLVREPPEHATDIRCALDRDVDRDRRIPHEARHRDGPPHPMLHPAQTSNVDSLCERGLISDPTTIAAADPTYAAIPECTVRSCGRVRRCSELAP